MSNAAVLEISPRDESPQTPRFYVRVEFSLSASHVFYFVAPDSGARRLCVTFPVVLCALVRMHVWFHDRGGERRVSGNCRSVGLG